MSNDTNKPPKFEPDIPAHLLHGKSASERWLYERISVHDQRTEWVMERLQQADEHRTHINRVVDDLKMEVRPAVRLAAWVMTVRGVMVGAATLIVIPLVVMMLKEWVAANFKAHREPVREQQQQIGRTNI